MRAILHRVGSPQHWMSILPTATLALLTVATAARAADVLTAEEKRATIAYLRGLQADDGGFRLSLEKDALAVSSLRATSSAVRALLLYGSAPANVEKCKEFVEKCYRPEEGAFADSPDGRPDIFPTAVGAMALVALKMDVKGRQDRIVSYLGAKAGTFEEIRIAAAAMEAFHVRPLQADEWTLRMANIAPPVSNTPESGAARTVASAIVTQLRLRGRIENGAAVLDLLRAGEYPGGGWGKQDAGGADLDTSYRVLRAFVMLKGKPANKEKLLGFIAKCRNADGGYGVTPGAPSSAFGAYFASTLLAWLSAM